MAKGGFNMPGGMGNMMKQVQRMQRKMEETQKMLEETETVATSGGGAVEVKLNGKKEFIFFLFRNSLHLQLQPPEPPVLPNL